MGSLSFNHKSSMMNVFFWILSFMRSWYIASKNQSEILHKSLLSCVNSRQSESWFCACGRPVLAQLSHSTAGQLLLWVLENSWMHNLVRWGFGADGSTYSVEFGCVDWSWIKRKKVQIDQGKKCWKWGEIKESQPHICFISRFHNL